MTFDPKQIDTNSRLRILMVSLGCPKNLVDSESMCRILTDNGFALTETPEDADAIVVNTCGFIESAKKEAIDTLLEMADYKQAPGRCRFLVACGCMAQRYPQEIRALLPEVDAVLGTAHYADIAESLRTMFEGGSGGIRCSAPGSLVHLRKDRLISTRGYAYLKIAEGCANHCSYCAIPGMRGPFVSRSPEDILEEASLLAEQGYQEIILVAQDTTRYGTDLQGTGEPVTLAGLLRDLERISGIRRIRLMYCYLDGLTEELVDAMAASDKIARYLDIPIQHLSDRILRRMNRRDTADEIRAKIELLRTRIPGILLRSTVMVGFPGELDSDFRLLMKGLREIRFDRLGCFVFSPEEGTPADNMRPKVRRDVAERRMARVMELQRGITFQSNQARVGSVVTVMLDSISEDGVFYSGRSEGEAPEIDPSILVAVSSDDPGIGSMIPVRIVAATEYEMTGVTI